MEDNLAQEGGLHVCKKKGFLQNNFFKSFRVFDLFPAVTPFIGRGKEKDIEKLQPIFQEYHDVDSDASPPAQKNKREREITTLVQR
jgi:hypothetical protein